MLPERLALEHPQRSGIGAIVVLHRARLARHEIITRFALRKRNVRRSRRGAQGGKHQNSSGCPRHSTVILTDSVAVKPLSPAHSKLSAPLSPATGDTVMYGI